MLRRLHLCNGWLRGAHLQSRLARGLADSAAELIASVAGHLTDLRVEEFELAYQATTVRHALAHALRACTRLTRLKFGTVTLPFDVHSPPNNLVPLALSAPVWELSISGFGIPPSSVLDVFKPLAHTLTHVMLSNGAWKDWAKDKLSWTCPNVHFLSLHHFETDFALMETLFPKVHTLELGRYRSMSYTRDTNKDHTARHWRQLRQVSGDMEAITSFGNLRGCTVDRVALTSIDQQHLATIQWRAYLIDFLISVSPKLLRIKAEMEWVAAMELIWAVGLEMPSVCLLDLTIFAHLITVKRVRILLFILAIEYAHSLICRICTHLSVRSHA